MVQGTNVELGASLKPGMKLLVKLAFDATDTFGFSANLVGFKQDEYLIIDIPVKTQEALMIRKINNVSAAVHGLSDRKLGDIIAFNTSVLTSIYQPNYLLFLRFPKHFVSKPLRAHERYKLSLPAQIGVNTVNYPATMRDFSASGCALFVGGENELKCQTIVNIDSELSSYLPAELRYQIVSIQKQPQGHLIGIQFDNPITISEGLKRQLVFLFYLDQAV